MFRTIDTNAHVEALANGEVDAVDVGPDANKYRRALAIEGVSIRVAGGPNFRHLTINGTSPVLSDVRVRRALAMAIDRGAIARALLGPLGFTPEPLNNHIFMTNQRGYRDNSGEIGKYDPEKAARLLDEAGWVLARQHAHQGRSCARNHVRDSERHPERAPGNGVDPEHAGPSRRQDEHRHRPQQRFLRQVRDARSIRFHRVLVARHAVSR